MQQQLKDVLMGDLNATIDIVPESEDMLKAALIARRESIDFCSPEGVFFQAGIIEDIFVEHLGDKIQEEGWKKDIQDLWNEGQEKRYD